MFFYRGIRATGASRLSIRSPVIDATPFLPSHVTSIAARAAELERLADEEQDPDALVRAARLYTLAVRIADEIDQRAASPFTARDLARVRTELRDLATGAVTGAPFADRALAADRAAGSYYDMTRAFREIALRIEQRLAEGNGLLHRHPDANPGT